METINRRRQQWRKEGSSRQPATCATCCRLTCFTVAPYHAPLSGHTMCTTASSSSPVMSRRFSFRNTLGLRRALEASPTSAEDVQPCHIVIARLDHAIHGCRRGMHLGDAPIQLGPASRPRHETLYVASQHD